MVFKDSQANFETALATFVIGDIGRKYGRSNQGSEVKTTYRTKSAFQTNEHSRLSGQSTPFLIPKRMTFLSLLIRFRCVPVKASKR